MRALRVRVRLHWIKAHQDADQKNRKLCWKQQNNKTNGSYFVVEGVPEHDMEKCGSKLRGRTKHNKGAVQYLGNHHCNKSDMEISY